MFRLIARFRPPRVETADWERAPDTRQNTDLDKLEFIVGTYKQQPG
ncbi:MAG: hypothetical protein QW587_04310 [Candidatus Bathyarchaeia archaeon]